MKDPVKLKILNGKVILPDDSLTEFNTVIVEFNKKVSTHEFFNNLSNFIKGSGNAYRCKISENKLLTKWINEHD